MSVPGRGSLPGTVGRFPVEALLGTGGFASVYRARDERLDADVAVKVLAENHAYDPGVRERFTLEGRLLRRVADPHVLAVGEGEPAARNDTEQDRAQNRRVVVTVTTP